MTILKRLNYELVCNLAAAIIVVLLQYPCHTISGEVTLGGRRCLNTEHRPCGDTEAAKKDGAHCLLARWMCVGIHDDYTCQNLSVSNCGVSAYCVPGFNEMCY